MPYTKILDGHWEIEMDDSILVNGEPLEDREIGLPYCRSCGRNIVSCECPENLDMDREETVVFCGWCCTRHVLSYVCEPYDMHLAKIQ